MALLSWLFGGDDHQLATTKYAGRPSATDRANGKNAKRTARNLLRHHNGGAQRAARKGQAWDDQQRRTQGGY